MPKCSKFQSQSRILNTRFIIALMLVGIILVPIQVFGEDEASFKKLSEDEWKQRLSEIIEVPLKEQKIIFEFGIDGDTRVKHIIQSGNWNENNPRMIKILPEIHTNLEVLDEDGYRLIHFWNDETFEKSEYVILQQKLVGYDVIVAYDIKNFFEYNDGLWKKQIEFESDVEIILDEEIDTVFANSRPIDVSDSDGINCVGCNMLIEFFDRENTTVEKYIIEDKDEQLRFWSDGEIFDLKQIKGADGIYFEIEKNYQLVVLEIPLEVMLSPFEVYHTENDDNVLDQIDKIRNTEFALDEKGIKLTIRPETVGNVWIIGSTQNEHDMYYAKTLKQQEEVIEEVIEEESVKEILDPRELYDDWGETPQTEDDNTVFYIIGGVISVIILGVIIKLKKN